MKTLSPTAMKQTAEYTRKNFHVEVGPEITIEDVLKPGFWQHHVNKLDKHDLIEVLGFGWELRLRVLEKGLGFAKTRVLGKWEDRAVTKAAAESADVVVPDGYVVDHTPKTKWRARLVDGTEIIRGVETKQAAADAAVAHARQTGAIAA